MAIGQAAIVRSFAGSASISSGVSSDLHVAVLLQHGGRDIELRYPLLLADHELPVCRRRFSAEL